MVRFHMRHCKEHETTVMAQIDLSVLKLKHSKYIFTSEEHFSEFIPVLIETGKITLIAYRTLFEEGFYFKTNVNLYIENNSLTNSYLKFKACDTTVYRHKEDTLPFEVKTWMQVYTEDFEQSPIYFADATPSTLTTLRSL